MIVVSDTSPLNYLVLIDAVGALPKLFDEVLVTPSVMSELSSLKTPPKVKQWSNSPPAWLKVAAPSTRLPFTARLDAGEADALSLAKEMGISHVLIDERRGRKVAIQEGLIPIPTLTILEEAAEDNLIHLPTAIASLRTTSIRIPNDLFDAALARDALRRKP